jgi:heme exporter protein A
LGITAIKLKALTKRYGFHRALKGIDLELKHGVCALLGPNGAGKSTLLGIVSTLVRPTSGTVIYENDGEATRPSAELRRELGILAHDSFLYGGLSALENLAFWGRVYGVDSLEERSRELLREVGLEESAWERPCSGYSRGMQQRLALARTVLHRPSVLLLDEPFTGLDRGGAEALGAMLRRWVSEGTTVLVITHDLESIGGITDHVAVLQAGKIAFEMRGEAFSYSELRDLYHEHTQ